jgi:hypothetical protein
MPHMDTPGSIAPPAGTVSRESLTAPTKKLVPLEVGRSEAMTLGKVTIPAPAVAAANTVILSVEGALANVGVLTVASRNAGIGFTVECVLTTSTARVNYAIYE